MYLSSVMSMSKQTTQILIITCVARDSKHFHKIYQTNFCQISHVINLEWREKGITKLLELASCLRPEPKK